MRQALYLIFHMHSSQPYENDVIIISTLQMRKLSKLLEVTWPVRNRGKIQTRQSSSRAHVVDPPSCTVSFQHRVAYKLAKQ